MESPPLSNAAIAERFDLMADLLELEGAVVYRVLAYRRAAQTLRETAESVARLSAEKRLTSLPGVGQTIADKVAELLETGDIAALVRLVDRNPPGAVQVMRLQGVGPKTARRIFDELGLRTVEDVREAATAGRIRTLQGLGEKTEATILAGLADGDGAAAAPRRSIARARALADMAVADLNGCDGVVRCEVAGSVRRYRETAKDVDIVAAVTDRVAATEAFAAAEWVAEVESRGDSRVAARAHDGTLVELRMVPPGCYGNLLQHLTGSKAHNVALREAAVRAGLKVSEYGIEDVESGEVWSSDDEAEVYEHLGLPFIPPELREGRGELEAARAGRLPDLVAVARHPRRPAHPHRLERRQGDARADGGRRARPRLRVPERHRPLARRRVRDGPRRRPAARADRARARAGRDARARLHAARRAPRWTSCATARSTTPTSCSPSSTSSSRACTPPTACRPPTRPSGCARRSRTRTSTSSATRRGG